jgi:enoyl-CoA hydratase/carnithine racemase
VARRDHDMTDEQLVLVERQDEQRTALVRINRPKQLNALNGPTMDALCDALEVLDRDDAIRAMVVTGNERAFAAGADIGEMAGATPIDMLKSNRIGQWDRVRRISKPVIAAVNGWCLGGGCELAMTLDLIVAGQSAKFGQPEISIGIIPGAGGTQRLTRLVGPSRAKDIIFSGRFVKADEALAIGLVDRVYPADQVYDEAVAWARQFSSAATYALRAAKESIDQGLEVDLDSGLAIERQQFAALFATEDRRIGMTSFVENGPGKAEFQGR